MTICIDAREFTRTGRTGIGRYLENLIAAAMPGFPGDAVLAVHDAEAVPQGIRNSRLHCVQVPRSPSLWVDQVVLPRVARQYAATLFFSPYYKTPLRGAFKRIITVHDIMFLRLPGQGLLKRFMQATQLRLAARKTDVILVDSEFTRKDLTAYIPGAAAKITVLYPGLEASWFEPSDPEAVRQAHTGYADNRPFLLYVGNFKPHKNVDLLVRAFAELDSSGGSNGRLLVLAGGDPRNSGRINDLVGSLGKQNAIRIHEHVPDPDLKALYSCADWFITASEYEGFGYPIAEAMACGCPVICRPCTSIPEVTGGYAVDMGSSDIECVSAALHEATAMPQAARTRLAGRGRSHIGTFTTERTSSGFLDMITEITGTHAG